MDSSNIIALLLALPVFVAAFTIHEFAHAWAAVKLGDDTPRQMGRLTLDPMSHLDPIGSLMFIMSALSKMGGIGWAKPVPFNPRNLGNPRRDTILIAVAGPASNLLQVPFWLLAIYIARQFVPPENWPGVFGKNPLPDALYYMLTMGVVINVSLAAFNMIPIPPLDGHYVLEGLGPPSIAQFFDSIRPYSFMLLFLISTLPGRPLSAMLSPFRHFAFESAYRAMGAY